MNQVRLDPDLSPKLRDQSRRSGRSLTKLVNLLLRRQLGLKAAAGADYRPSAGALKAAARVLRRAEE